MKQLRRDTEVRYTTNLLGKTKKTTTGQQQKLKTKITQETISEECKHSGQAQLNHPRSAKT